MRKTLESGTVRPIQRHHFSSETVGILREKNRWIFLDESDNETERVILYADGEPIMLNVDNGHWHSLNCLASGSFFYESKDVCYTFRWKRMKYGNNLIIN